MTPFHFRLQPVLRHKQKVEDDLKLELANLETLRAEAVLSLVALDSERERVRSAVKAGMHGHVDVDAVARGLRHSDWLDARRREMIEALEALAQRVEAKRQEVVEGMRDRKALERLRDRDQVRYDAERLHAEQTLLDEVGTSRHHRRLGEPVRSSVVGR